eukprot:2044661-Amphidinium_carterae.1
MDVQCCCWGKCCQNIGVARLLQQHLQVWDKVPKVSFHYTTIAHNRGYCPIAIRLGHAVLTERGKVTGHQKVWHICT